MFDQLIKMIEQFFEQTGLIDIDSEFNITAAVLAIASTICVFISCLVRYSASIIRWLKRKKPVDSLYNSLRRQHAVVSKKELIYQIRSYRSPQFADEKTFKQLLQEIKKSSGERQDLSPLLFYIVGNPACGKTTTMRYLYCALAKKHRCVYFQMQGIDNMEGMRQYLFEQKAENCIPDGASVIGFFDGLDEAYRFFQEENPESVENALNSLFSEGIPKIHNIFRELNLVLRCSVVSLRPEFLERSIQSLEPEKYDAKIYEMQPMPDRDVIKTFKSLRLLKRLDAGLDRENQRHQNRCPPFGQRYKYVRLLRKILKENPDCLFHYPMYIRYAYPFMQEYLTQAKSGSTLSLSNNFSLSLEILLKAIIKWEFHIYYKKKSVKNNPDEFNNLRNQLEQCAQECAKLLAEGNQQRLSKKEFSEILKKFFPDEVQGLAMAHCFMESDDEGKQVFFCHSTFYEYYLAQYMIFQGNYRFRKEQLCSNMASDNLRDMYYSILCQKRVDLNGQISNSIENVGMDVLTPHQYRALELQKIVDVKSFPSISMVGMLEYLPCIQTFRYQNELFPPENLEKIMDTGHLNLEIYGWDHLEYGQGIIHPNRVTFLNISWMPLNNATALNKYQSLKWLEIRFSNEETPLLDEIFSIIKKHTFEWIHIYSETGVLCERIQHLISKGELQVNDVFVHTPNYCQAYIKICQINQAFKENRQSIKFLLSRRTDVEAAKKKYYEKKIAEEGELLEAVFELEAEENGYLGLAKKNAEATLWNGLALTSYYQEQDAIDRDWKALNMCKSLEPYIQKDESLLSTNFGEVYGNILFYHGQYDLAKEWLLYSYQYSEKYLCQWCMARVGLELYRTWISSKTTGVEQFEKELEIRLKQLPDYQKTWHYVQFQNYRSRRTLHNSKEEVREPKSIFGYLKHALYNGKRYFAHIKQEIRHSQNSE